MTLRLYQDRCLFKGVESERNLYSVRFSDRHTKESVEKSPQFPVSQPAEAPGRRWMTSHRALAFMRVMKRTPTAYRRPNIP